MKVLVVGGGGREHALCWAIARSSLCEALICAPGNGGIARDAECVALDPMDIDGIVAACRARAIDLVVVGPEAPLVAGLADRLDDEGIAVFGPRRGAAALEGSKGFARDLCRDHGIPGPAYGRFTDAEAARAYVRERGAPIVVKADGLAAGKGVTVAATLDEALAAIDAIAAGRFGAAGAEIVVEECLVGEEASFFAIVDGARALPLAGAQDHKALGEGDIGPNTGGMGAYSPAPVITPALADDIMDRVINPTVRAMAESGHPFKGVLFAGLMITEQGPKVLEYNVRFGDPECQVLMARLESDLLPVLAAAAAGDLGGAALKWRDEAALCVVMASRGYPGDYERNTEIKGLDGLDADGLTVFHAATRTENGRVLATGGRVLGVTARGADVAAAQARAYAAVDRIDWAGGFCRRDIGWRAVGR